MNLQDCAEQIRLLKGWLVSQCSTGMESVQMLHHSSLAFLFILGAVHILRKLCLGLMLTFADMGERGSR